MVLNAIITANGHLANLGYYSRMVAIFSFVQNYLIFMQASYIVFKLCDITHFL